MSKIPVEIDYVKVAQYVYMVEYFTQKLKDELDKAVREKHDRKHITTNSDT